MEDMLLDIVTENSVAILRMNNPPVNALSRELITRLKTAFLEMEKKGAVKAVIITGAGRVFCAGADIKELAAIKTRKDGEAFAKSGQEMMDMIENFNIPVIAAVNGACIGGGNELAMACHLRIAAENAWFSQPEINLGIIPGFGGTQRLPRLIGKGRAVEMILTGSKLTAREALTIGLLNKIVPGERLMAEAKRIAAEIAMKGKLAIRSGLQAIYGREREDKLFGRLCETEDKETGIRAFLEKKKGGQ
ncbi:MAG: enoyl-CoA hydratase/isomerase family protein [Deltaproteobacteria bacterium]|nr:enoyl-CoA hydratase/isomerase family protein [Deltaproteobacteria bacterium]